jgi:hypothetical protein
MKKKINLLNKKNNYIIIFLFAFSVTIGCKRKVTVYNEDINPCDSIGNYYEESEHFIKRDLVTDEGVINYEKLFDRYKGRHTECNPLNYDKF